MGFYGPLNEEAAGEKPFLDPFPQLIDVDIAKRKGRS